MGQLLLFIVVALVVAAIVFGVTVLMSGGDPGLTRVEPDGRAAPLPADRPLGEDDIGSVRFDTALRGYRMAQVDQALQRAAYDIGYKSELIGVLEAEVAALRDGRIPDADALRRAREAAIAPVRATAARSEGDPEAHIELAPPAEAQATTPAGPQLATPAGPQLATPAGPPLAPPAGPQLAPPAGPQVTPPAGPPADLPGDSEPKASEPVERR